MPTKNRDWEHWENTGEDFLRIFLNESDDVLMSDAGGLILNFLSSVKDELNILDIGCGPAVSAKFYSKYLQREFRYHGIDITPTNIKIAIERCLQENISFSVGDIFKIPTEEIKRNDYNIVIVKDVLEHLPPVKDNSKENYILALNNIVWMSSKYVLVAIDHLLLDGKTVITRKPSGFPNNENVTYYNNYFSREEIYNTINSKTQTNYKIDEQTKNNRTLLIVEK